MISSNIHELANIWWLARFTAPEIIFLLLSEPYVQWESFWLPPRSKCHYSLHSGPHGSYTSEHGKTISCPSTIMGSLLGRNVQVISSLNPQSHVTETHELNSKTVLSNYGKKPKETVMVLNCLGSLLELHEHLKGDVTCIVWSLLLDSLGLFGGEEHC